MLPFTNVSGDANTDYLSDGITESLIASLAHVDARVSLFARSTPDAKDLVRGSVVNGARSHVPSSAYIVNVTVGQLDSSLPLGS